MYGTTTSKNTNWLLHTSKWTLQFTSHDMVQNMPITPGYHVPKLEIIMSSEKHMFLYLLNVLQIVKAYNCTYKYGSNYLLATL